MNVSRLVERLRGQVCLPRDRRALRRVLEAARAAGAVPPREADWLVAALELGELRLRNALVPRVDVVAVPEDCPADAAARRMAESGRRRLPVYRSTLDQVVGILHALDVARALADRAPGAALPIAGALARAPLFLPAIMPLPEALEAMRRQAEYVALVVDERGGLAGLATLEDLLEQLVGPLPDEYGDEGRDAIRVLGPGEAIVGAAAGLHEVERALGVRLPDRRVSSVGGLVYERLGRVPRPGDVVEVPGARIEVLSVQGVRLRDLRVRRWPFLSSSPPEAARQPAKSGPKRLRVGSAVVCADGERAGKLEGVVMEPASGRLTHLVVRRDLLPPRRHLVSADLVERVSEEVDDAIHVRLTRPELDRLPAYDPAAHVAPARSWRAGETDYAAGEVLFALGGSPAVLHRLTPATHGSIAATADQRVAAPGKAARSAMVELSRRTEVVCDDGPVGRVDLLLLDPATGAATHVVVRRGWLGLLAPRDLVVPLAWARKISPERIELAVGRAELELLPEYRPDHELVGEVYQALRDDPRFQGIEFYTLHPEVHDGVVLLRGHVRTAEQKAAAEALVRGVRGVLGVENRLVADDELVEAVGRALEDDPRIRAGSIEVGAFLGLVTLRGRVATADEREEAARVARRVPGVQAVANQLEVEPGGDASAERWGKGEEQ